MGRGTMGVQVALASQRPHAEPSLPRGPQTPSTRGERAPSGVIPGKQARQRFGCPSLAGKQPFSPGVAKLGAQHAPERMQPTIGSPSLAETLEGPHEAGLSTGPTAPPTVPALPVQAKPPHSSFTNTPSHKEGLGPLKHSPPGAHRSRCIRCQLC